MKRILSISSFLLAALLLTASLGVSFAETVPASETKALIVYFSRVGNSAFEENVDVVTSASLNVGEDGALIGNMQVLANMISEHTGADVFEIQVTELYPSAYRATTNQAKEEQNKEIRPELATQVENMADYGVIYLGYPNWWGELPMAVCTFLESYDFSGKTIIPFCSHEGSGLGGGPRQIAELCPNATLLDGFAVRGGSVMNAQEDLLAWLDNLGV